MIYAKKPDQNPAEWIKIATCRGKGKKIALPRAPLESNFLCTKLKTTIKGGFAFDGAPFLHSSNLVKLFPHTVRTPVGRRMTLLLSLLVPILPTCVSAKYESTTYKIERKEGSFEIRDYPELTLVSAPIQKRGADGSFMKLFRFIQGKNDRSEKISMTTPVLMTGTESGTMSFVIPKQVAQRGAPAPSNPDLTVSTKPAGRYAAYCFSGSGKPAPSEAAALKLQAWVAGQKLAFTGGPIFAYYNPPWTPGFLRRNEVLLPLGKH